MFNCIINIKKYIYMWVKPSAKASCRGHSFAHETRGETREVKKILAVMSCQIGVGLRLTSGIVCY